MDNRLNKFFRLCLIVAVLIGTAPTCLAARAELDFKVMMSTWRVQDHSLVQADSGRLDLYLDGSLEASYFVSDGGRLDFSIPYGRTSRWVLIVGAHRHRTFRAEFRDNLLYLHNEDRNDRPVEYYELADGSYALEYFQDNLYITNQGQTDAPVLGKILAGDQAGASQPDRDVWAKLNCNLTNNPTQSIGSGGGTGSFWVSVNCVSDSYDAISQDSWITITGSCCGHSTEATIPYSVDSNSGANRSGSVILKENASGDVFGTVVFNQEGATYPPPPEDGFGFPDNPNQVVGGVLTGVGPLGPGQTGGCMNDALTGGGSCVDNLAAGFGFGGGGGGSSVVRGGGAPWPATIIDPSAGGMPGVVFQWIYAGDKAPEEFFLPIGADGELANGITWQTIFDVNASGVPMFVILRSFPPEFLISLGPGDHTLNYWLVDSDGNKSNQRTDKVTIN